MKSRKELVKEIKNSNMGAKAKRELIKIVDRYIEVLRGTTVREK